jgi:hypothetical protein
MAEGSLSFDFHIRPVPPNLLLAKRLRGAATDDNLKRILSETDNGVNRWQKILKVIRPCKASDSNSVGLRVRLFPRSPN